MPEFTFISDLSAANKVADKWEELMGIFKNTNPFAVVDNMEHTVAAHGAGVVLSVLLTYHNVLPVKKE